VVRTKSINPTTSQEEGPRKEVSGENPFEWYVSGGRVERKNDQDWILQTGSHSDHSGRSAIPKNQKPYFAGKEIKE